MSLDPTLKKELEKKLTEEKQRLEKTLAAFAKKDPKLEGDYDTRFPNFGTALDESADEVEEYENLLPAEHALELLLKDVHHALKKFPQGHYGQCENCKKDIRPDRLRANPEAKICMDCAKKESAET